MSNQETVLVIGAGPVGLTMASELARYGVKLRIVERAAQRTDKSKALVVWSRTLELMDAMGCSAKFLAEGLKVRAMDIFANGEMIAHVQLDVADSPHPFALMIPQSDTERLLEEYLNGQGVQVERGVELTDFTPGESAVAATLRRPDGAEEKAEAGWLIGCDGAHSAVRHRLGMPFSGETLLSDWILADLHLTGMPNPENVYAGWSAAGVLMVFPIRGDRFRVVADVPHQDAARADPTLDDVRALLSQRGLAQVQAADPVWLANFRINERKVADYRAGRVFLAGDAAHVHSPAGGQGMNTGIQDACNLAWKLALVCRGIAAEEPLLASYSIERSAVGDKVVKNADRLTKLGVMHGEFKQALRNHMAGILLGFSPVQRLAANEITEVAIAYPDSPLTEKGVHVSGGPTAGQRAPIRDGETAIGSGSTPQFALCAEEGPDSARLTARFPQLLDPKLRTPLHEGGAWLVRPDGYVAMAVPRQQIEKVGGFLAKIAQ